MAESTPAGERFQRPDLPQGYDRELVPRIFDPWAAHLLDIVKPLAGEAALDVACGPGTVARQLARRVGPSGRVTGADLSEPMLAVARSKPTTPDMAPITWVKSPAAPLDVPDGAFDLATCQQGMQFFPDQVAALKEIHRALKRGGRVAFAVWSDPAHSVLPVVKWRDRVMELLGESGTPGFGKRTGEMTEALVAAGFTQVVEANHSLEVNWTDRNTVLQGLTVGPGWDMLTRLTEDQRTSVMEELHRELAQLDENTLQHFLSRANLAWGMK